MIQYQNGNSTVELHADGTRITQFEDKLELDFPLNIDIRVSSKCAFGLNPKTGTAFCNFCHEQATTDGSECNYEKLKEKLYDLPKGIELAIGSNQLTFELYEFLYWCSIRGYIVNLTVNQGHLKRDYSKIKMSINTGLIKGLGISYRSSLKWEVPSGILNYQNTVFHVIAGIDNIEDILTLKDKGVKKILVLGEKDFGFNFGKVDLTSRSHREWYWWVHKLFFTFDVVSFDNLALEQLNIKRFLSDKHWEIFHNGEHSMYINAVDEYFSPSSRNPLRTNWNDLSIKEYFHNLENIG